MTCIHPIYVSRDDYDIALERGCGAVAVHIARLSKVTRATLFQLREDNQRLYEESQAAGETLIAGIPDDHPRTIRLCELVGYTRVAAADGYTFLRFEGG